MNMIHNTNLRLNMEKETHRRAWEYLQTLDKEKYKSYSNVIAMALVAYFERAAKLKDDPYFETREREERFITQVLNELQKALEKSLPLYLAGYRACISNFTTKEEEHHDY